MVEIKQKPSEVQSAIMEALKTVMDPEIPVLSLVDLGMIPEIEVVDDAFIKIYLTPTFSG
jgi:ring-1,2-phenylacetyl-CoA epoxidase subunit PaaD